MTSQLKNASRVSLFSITLCVAVALVTNDRDFRHVMRRGLVLVMQGAAGPPVTSNAAPAATNGGEQRGRRENS